MRIFVRPICAFIGTTTFIVAVVPAGIAVPICCHSAASKIPFLFQSIQTEAIAETYAPGAEMVIDKGKVWPGVTLVVKL